MNDYTESWAQRNARLAEEESAKVFNRRLQYLIIILPVIVLVGYYVMYLLGEWVETDLPIAI